MRQRRQAGVCWMLGCLLLGGCHLANVVQAARRDDATRAWRFPLRRPLVVTEDASAGGRSTRRPRNLLVARRPSSPRSSQGYEQRLESILETGPPGDDKKNNRENVEWQDFLAQARERRGRKPWTAAWETLRPLLEESRPHWGRWAASGLQLGLVVYLAHSVWKAANEVLDEYYAGEANGGGMDPPIFTRDHIGRALEQLEEHAVRGDSSDLLSWRADERTLAALAIAQRLVLVGLPLRGNDKDKNDSTPDDRPSVESVLASLGRSEANLLQECLWLPPPTKQSPRRLWDRIVGLDHVRRGLSSALSTVERQSHSSAYASLFDNSSAGVLLYGPPGCGKTMLAMALSSMARMPCLLVTPSVLLRKYVGETNQQCRTLFSLAQKLSPCILCIDELDGLFRKRSDNEHEVSRDLKTEFLQNWEGMLSRPVRNLIVAATNRPFDVDEAVLRRFSQSHLVGLPDVTMRTLYLRGLIQEIPTTNDVDASQLAIQTEGYTPSDLRRLLQTAAALGPLRESASQPRPLSTADIQRAIQMVPSTFLSGDYRQALSHFIRSNQPAPESALPNRYLPHGSDGSSSVMYEDEDGRWETEWGNFYNLGSLQVDTPTFDVLSGIVERLNDMAEEEFFDMDGDGEDDYSPDDAEDGH